MRVIVRPTLYDATDVMASWILQGLQLAGAQKQAGRMHIHASCTSDPMRCTSSSEVYSPRI